MDQPQFEALVQRMARFAHSSPLAYRWWVYALAAFGFASLVLLVFALLVLLTFAAEATAHAAAGLNFVIIIGALLLVVVRALWVRLQPPAGEPLLRGEAPAFLPCSIACGRGSTRRACIKC